MVYYLHHCVLLYVFIESILDILKIEYHLSHWGVCSLGSYSVAYKETQSDRVSDIRDFVCSLFPKSILFWLLFARMSWRNVYFG